MGILPYERFTIETVHTKDEASRRLRNAVAAPTYSLRRSAQPFRGHVTGDTFVIHRVLGYRNSFRPRVVGRILPGQRGAVVELTLAMDPVIQIFMGIWLSIATVMFVGLGIADLRHADFSADVGIGPFLFLPFGLLLCLRGFRAEVGKTKAALSGLFDHSRVK